MTVLMHFISVARLIQASRLPLETRHSRIFSPEISGRILALAPGLDWTAPGCGKEEEISSFMSALEAYLADGRAAA